jgi:Domain of unknown function (DUF4157)
MTEYLDNRKRNNSGGGSPQRGGLAEPIASTGPTWLSSTVIQPRIGLSIQRQAEDNGTAPPVPEEAVAPSDAGKVEPSPEKETTAQHLIVEDGEDPGPGQMTKSDFLARLREAVCHTAEEALAGTMWSTAGCPWIEHWFDYYGDRDSGQVERAIRRYVPESAAVASADDYIPLIAARVRRGIETWSSTGEVPDVPQEFTAPVEAAVPAPPAVNLKAQASGEPVPGASPSAVRSELGPGVPLDSVVRTRVGAAVSQDLSRVRVHADFTGSSVSQRLNARAFAVGEHIAFAAGEYRPGTMAGDALIAHELAHVAQQKDSPATASQRASTPELEGEADSAAAATVAGMWGLRNVARNAGPRLRSGLQLHRCNHCPGTKTSATTTAVPARYDWKDKALQSKVDDAKETAATVRTYFDGLAQPDKDIAKTDLERGRVDYVTFRKTLDPADAGVAGLSDSIDKMDVVLAGLYRAAIMSVAPGTPAPLTEYAPGTAPAALTAGTHSVTAADRTAIDKALTPTGAVNPLTGAPPVFTDLVGGKTYSSRIEQRLRDGIDEQFNKLAAGKAALHAVPSNLHGWAHLEAIAKESKQETDKVFGSYAQRTAFKSGTNLFDRWEQQETEIAAASPTQKLDIANWRVLKIFKDDKKIEKINQEHGFVSDRMPEQGKAEKVINDLANDPALQPKLLEIHKGWPGATDPIAHQVFIQRFKDPSDAKNRKFAWDTFETLIHEYIHTLNHSAYTTYADLQPTGKGHVLREGMTDAFTKIVWAGITFDATLRANVEGPYHDPAVTFPIPAMAKLPVYPVARNAEEVISIVGLPNAAAAYFLGDVTLIGKV